MGLRVEQFVYTKGRDGYQVVASSGGIGRDVIDGMQGYLYPAGVDPLAFPGSRSLVTLDGGLAAYSIVQNIGVGPDGRDGTFYNHTFVVDAAEFQESGCDSRPFDRLYMGGIRQGDELSTLHMNPPEMPSMPVGDAAAALGPSLEALLDGDRLAVASGDRHLPQEILMALPRHLRLVPFSTLVISPKRQPRYRLIMNPGFAASPPSGFVTVDPARPAAPRESVAHYSRLVLGHKHQKVKEIQTMLGSLLEGADLQKLDLSCAYSGYCAAGAPDRAGRARQVLRMAENLGERTRFAFHGLVRDDLPRDDWHRAEPARQPAGPGTVPDFAPSREQALVIGHREGYLAVEARPGSGRTEALGRRMAGIISETDNKDAGGIVVFTPTARAAREMRARIQGNLKEGASMPRDLFVGTTDSFCLHVLRRLDPRYHAYDVLGDLERVAFIDLHRTRLKINKLRGRNMGNKIRRFCDTADIAAREGIRIRDMTDEDFVQSHEEYHRAMEEERFMDSVTAAGRLLDLLASDKGNIAALGVRHLVIDGYQDVDPQQQRLIEMLSGGATSVCAAGDADRAIFRWRGGDPGRLAKFQGRTAERGGLCVKLSTNYRATDGLVDCASGLITRGRGAGRIEMRADPARPNKSRHGELVYRTLASRDGECAFIHRCMLSLAGKRFETGRGARRISYGDMAVLAHTGDDAAYVARFLRRNNIECEVEGGTARFRDPVSLLALDCLLHALGRRGAPAMSDLEMRYRLTLGGDMGAFRRGMAEAAEEGRRRPSTRLSRRGSRTLLRVLSAMGAEKGSVRNHMPSLADLSKAVTGYEYASGGLTITQARKLGAFIRTLEQYGLAMPSDRGASGRVRIMTIRGAGGLEFPVVFVPKMTKRRGGREDPPYLDGSLYPAGRYRGGREDGRQLLYAAATRSQRYLVLTDTGPARHAPMPRTCRGMFADELDAGEDIVDGAAVVPRASHLTYGMAEAYGRCPYEYYLRHVLEYREGLEPESDYAKNVLAMLNVIHAGGRRGGVPSGEEMAAMTDATFHMRLATGSTESKLRRDAARVLSRYAGRHGMILGNEGSAVRTGRVFGGSSVTDVADLVGGDGRVTLFRPGRGAQNEHERHAARAAFCAASVGSGEGYVHYMSTGRSRRAVAEGSLEVISRAVSGINAGDFAAAPEREKCKACGLARICDRKGSALDGTG